jgi:hypothetical protein
MPKDPLEVHLKAHVRRASRRAERDLDNALRALGKKVATGLEDYGFESKAAHHDRSKLTQRVRAQVAILDACEFIEWSLLDAPNATCVTIPVRSSDAGARWLPVRRRIDELFRTRRVSDRGQCYVAWSRSPLEFLYVGRGHSRGRLDLMANGTLALALAEATQLTLALPAIRKHLEALEGALIAILDPRLNQKCESVPEGEASRDVNQVGAYLKEVAVDLWPLRPRRRQQAAGNGDGPDTASPPPLGPDSPPRDVVRVDPL